MQQIRPVRLRRMSFYTLWVMLLLSALLGPSHRLKAQGTAVACFSVYEDQNRNGVRDSGETAALNVNVSLRIAEEVVIANDVTTSSEPVCFALVSADIPYTVAINSPRYEALDPTPLAFTLTQGQSFSREIGVVGRAADPDALSRPLTIPLTPTNRIVLALSCAGLAMAFLTGIGLMLYGLFAALRGGRRQAHRRAPANTQAIKVPRA